MTSAIRYRGVQAGTSGCALEAVTDRAGSHICMSNDMTIGPQSAFVATAPAPMADSRLGSAPDPLIGRIWPSAIIALGLGLTVAWVCFLGYAVARLIEIAL